MSARPDSNFAIRDRDGCCLGFDMSTRAKSAKWSGLQSSQQTVGIEILQRVHPPGTSGRHSRCVETRFKVKSFREEKKYLISLTGIIVPEKNHNRLAVAWFAGLAGGCID
jgi:hypothetical protein